MKKLIVIPFIMIFLISCAGIQLNDTQSILGEIAARRLAYSLAKAHPEIIPTGIAICEGMMGSSGDNLNALTYKALDLLVMKMGDDPMLQADLLLVLKLTGMGNIDAPIPNQALIKQAASAFKVGLEAAKERR